VEVNCVDRVFDLAGSGNYIALKGIDLEIRKGQLPTTERSTATVGACI
jgi:hypothetical protein